MKVYIYLFGFIATILISSVVSFEALANSPTQYNNTEQLTKSSHAIWEDCPCHNSDGSCGYCTTPPSGGS